MKTITPILALLMTLVCACQHHADSKPTTDAASTPDAATTGPVPVSKVTLSIDLAATKGNVRGLANTAQLIFEQSFGASTENVQTYYKCEMPLKIQVTQGKKALDAAVSTGVREFFKKLGGPNGNRTLTSTFVVLGDSGPRNLDKGLPQDLMGSFKKVELAGKPGEFMMRNDKGMAWGLPIAKGFQSPVTLEFVSVKDTSASKNVLCLDLNARGFVLKK